MLVLNALIRANNAFFNTLWRGLNEIASAIKSSVFWAVGMASRGATAAALAIAVAAIFVALAVAAGIKYLLLGMDVVVGLIGAGLSATWAAVIAVGQWTAHAIEVASRPFIYSAAFSWQQLVRGIAAGDELVSRGINALRRGVFRSWNATWNAIVLAGNTVGPPLGLGIDAINRGITASVTAVFRWIGIVMTAIGSTLAAVAHAIGSGVAWIANRVFRVVAIIAITLASIVAIIFTLTGIGIAWVVGYVIHAIAVAFTAIASTLAIIFTVAGSGIAWGAGLVFHAVAVASAAVGSVLIASITAAGTVIAMISIPVFKTVVKATGIVWADVKAAGPPIGHALGFAWRQFATASSVAWDGVVLVNRLGLSILRYMFWPVGMFAKGAGNIPGFITYNVRIGFGVIPDLREAGVRRIGLSTMPQPDNLNLVARRIIPLAVMIWVGALGVAFMVNLLWPGPPPPRVTVDHWATGHLFFDGGLEEMAARFNAIGHLSESGLRIEVRVHNNPSSLQTEDLLSRVRDGKRLPRECCGPGTDPHVDPTIITPSSAHWIVPVNHALELLGRPSVIDLSSATTTRPMALAYVGIVTYQGMAECLGWPEKKIGFEEIIALSNDPRGWDSCPTASAEWGKKPLVAFTDPKESSTGRSVLLAPYSIASEVPPQEIDMAMVTGQEGYEGIEEYVREFAGLIDHYMIGTSVLNTKIHQGPRFGHFFLMPEDNLIHLKEGTVSAFFGGVKQGAPPHEAAMVMIYAKEGTMARNNCACLVNAPWVDAEEAAAADLWIDYLREEQQQRAFMRAGFRPVTGIPLLPNDPDNRITAEFGLNPETPSKILDVTKIRPDVANQIDARWQDVKRPSMVTFVVDTSGSMLVGGKIDKAKDGLTRALFNMPSNNRAGLVTFDDSVRQAFPVGLLDDAARASFERAVKGMRAAGETALYDAIITGIEMTDASPGDDDAIRAVVVLTDGQANRGATQLDHLVTMSSRGSEVRIRSFPGYVDHDPPIDVQNRIVDKANVTGTGMILDTTHDIQIFFIGIGDDADLDIGRILAEATGAEFQCVTEEDLANVLEELAGYF